MLLPSLGGHLLSFLLLLKISFADFRLTTNTPAYVTLREGDWYELQCVLNTCSDDIHWYKDDVFLFNSTKLLEDDVESYTKPLRLNHEFYTGSCNYDINCTLGDSSCGAGSVCLRVDPFYPNTKCCECVKDSFGLVIRNATLASAGRYRCQINNETLDFEVTVHTPLHVAMLDEFIRPKDDNTAEITCFVDGFPVPRVHFELNNERVDWEIRREHSNLTSVRLFGSYKPSSYQHSYTLLIQNVTDRAGQYKCIAESGAEKAFDYAKLGRSNATNPDVIHACCASKGVTGACLDVCRYGKRGYANCTEFADDMLSCAQDESDHTECCEKEGVPADKLFRCRNWGEMSETDAIMYGERIITCYVRGHEAPPSQPTNLRFSSWLFTSWFTFRIRVEWNLEDNRNSFVFYEVYYRNDWTKERLLNTTNDYIDLVIDGNGEWIVSVRAVNAVRETYFERLRVTADYSPKPFIILVLSTIALLSIVIGAVAWMLRRSGNTPYSLM